jgi:hypothetical protein
MLAAVTKAMKRFLFSLAALALLISLPACKTAPCDCEEPDDVPLFDGKTLNGWVIKGGTAKYRVEDGMIIGTSAESGPNTFLTTAKAYSNFSFECDVLCDKELNSGFQIRSHVYEKDTPQPSQPKRIRKAGEVYGYQCEISTADKGTSGNFWDEGRWTKWWDDLAQRPGATAAFKEGQWNHYKILARGDHIQSWVNGVACADFHDSLDAAGFIGLQVHTVGAGKGPFQVRWKNITIRELKTGAH